MSATAVLLFIDMHDSAADSSVHTVPLADVPPKVKKVLRAQPNPLDISVDEDGWRDLAEAAAEEEDEQELCSEECTDYFEHQETAAEDTTLMRNGVKVMYIVKKWWG